MQVQRAKTTASYYACEFILYVPEKQIKTKASVFKDISGGDYRQE